MVAVSALVAAVPLVLLIFIVKIPAGTRLKTKVRIGKMRKQRREAKSWTQITKNTHTVAGGNWKCHPCPPQGVCPTIWKQCFSLSWQTSTFHSSSPAKLKLGRKVLKAFPSSTYSLSHFCLFLFPNLRLWVFISHLCLGVAPQTSIALYSAWSVAPFLSKQMIIQKHCLRHNGPKGWVLSPM